VVHEAGSADQLRYAFPFAPGSWQTLLARDLVGVHDPTDAAQRAVLVEESFGLHVDRVTTPTLMQFGARAGAERAGRPLFSSYRRHGVPSAFFVYDEGHVFRRPAAVADDLTRTVEWLDHWVRGLAYPDPARAKEFDAWRTDAAVRRP
jgi:hypothetical protein